MMREGQAIAIHRADYAAPAYWIDTVDLAFDLDPVKTRVLNKMRLRRNPAVAPQPLRLDGEELNLARVLVNGAGTSFKIEDGELVSALEEVVARFRKGSGRAGRQTGAPVPPGAPQGSGGEA